MRALVVVRGAHAAVLAVHGNSRDRHLQLFKKGQKPRKPGRPAYVSATGVEELQLEAYDRGSEHRAIQPKEWAGMLHAKAQEEARRCGRNSLAVALPGKTTAAKYRRAVFVSIVHSACVENEHRMMVGELY